MEKSNQFTKHFASKSDSELQSILTSEHHVYEAKQAATWELERRFQTPTVELEKPKTEPELPTYKMPESEKREAKWQIIFFGAAMIAIVAIPGAIFAFYNLFNSDKAQEQQLKQLTNLANQAIQQTEILREELAVLSERNKILIEQLEIDKDKWHKEIRPEFSIQKIRQVYDENLDNGTFKFNSTPLVNQGGAVHIENVIISPNSTVGVEIPKTFVGRNGTLLINFEKVKKGDCQLDFSIVFRDIDNNRYIQRFYDNDEYLIVATSPEPFKNSR